MKIEVTKGWESISSPKRECISEITITAENGEKCIVTWINGYPFLQWKLESLVVPSAS